MKLIIVFFLIFSCSLQQKKPDVESVSVKINDDIISIDDSDDIVGDQSSQKKNPVIELNLFPSVYQTFAVINLLKELEKNEINISVINSTGIGLLVAVLYAKKKSINYLEWKLFDLQKKLSRHQPYSKEWSEELNEFTVSEFGETKLNQLKCLVGEMKVEAGRIIISSNRKIKDAIKNAIDLNSKDAPINNLEFPLHQGNRIVDISTSVIFMPSYPSLKYFKAYELGIYTGYLGRLKKSSEQYTYIEKTGSYYLDEFKTVNKIVEGYEDQIAQLIKDILDRIENWQG